VGYFSEGARLPRRRFTQRTQSTELEWFYFVTFAVKIDFY
jgi:hypothetical protein